MEKSTKIIISGLVLSAIGLAAYNIYGKELTVKGFTRPDGSYLSNRVCGAAIGGLGTLIIGYGVYLKLKK